jgi:hypothetical protein
VRSKRQSLLIGDPFQQRPGDARLFTDNHFGVKLCQFPKMRQISRKDLLGEYFHMMQTRYKDGGEFDFHPRTYNLPVDHAMLTQVMQSSLDPENDFWIVKPPNMNNGQGVYVINGADPEIPSKPCCVQRYIRNPLLIRGQKVSDN